MPVTVSWFGLTLALQPVAMMATFVHATVYVNVELERFEGVFEAA